MKLKAAFLLLALFVIGPAAAADITTVATIRTEAVLSWSQRGDPWREGTNLWEIQQGQWWTNTVVQAPLNGQIREVLLGSVPGPVLTNWCELRIVPASMSPGNVFLHAPPSPPFFTPPTNSVFPLQSR